MTTNEDIIREIATVGGHVEALHATTLAHIKQTEADAARVELRLNDHAARLKEQETITTKHLTRHSQTRRIGGVLLTLAGGLLTAIVAGWHKLIGGIFS